MFNPIRKLLDTKFRNKLIFMCIAAIVPVTVAGVFLLYNLIDLMRTNAGNEAVFEADSLKTRLKDTITTVSNIGDSLAESDALIKLVNNEFSTEDEYYGYYLQNQPISEYLSSYPQIQNISIYINREDFVYNEHFMFADEEITSQHWYVEAEQLQKSRWQLISESKDSKITEADTDETAENDADNTETEEIPEEKFLSLVKPIIGTDGTFRGVLVISVSPQWLYEITKETHSILVFSVGQGLVFYSLLNDFPVGSVVNDVRSPIPSGMSDSEAIDSITCPLTKFGRVAVSYFDYENTGNLFQVYIVKSNFFLNDTTKSAIFTYVINILLCVVLSVLLTILFSSIFSRRIQFLKDQMHNAAVGNFELAEDIKGTDEIYDLYADLKKMVDSMQELINDAYKAKIRSESFKLNQIEAEFKTLASQINPHFLYNTLETIRMKAYCNNDKETADLVKKLGKFMRRCLEVKDGMVTLGSELEFTRSYLELQSARFGDRISYSIYCEVNREYKILPLIIQPIVENAFAHGIESAKANGKITVNVRYKGDKVEISVSDNGQGMTPEKLNELLLKLKENDTSSGKSIGLTNVNKRIKMYHGDEYGLSIKTAMGEGTSVIIDLPREVDENVMKRLPEKYSEISENISSKTRK